MVCFTLIYRDPPATKKPAIRADKAELKAISRGNNNSTAISSLYTFNHGIMKSLRQASRAKRADTHGSPTYM